MLDSPHSSLSLSDDTEDDRKRIEGAAKEEPEEGTDVSLSHAGSSEDEGTPKRNPKPKSKASDDSEPMLSSAPPQPNQEFDETHGPCQAIFPPTALPQPPSTSDDPPGAYTVPRSGTAPSMSSSSPLLSPIPIIPSDQGAHPWSPALPAGALQFSDLDSHRATLETTASPTAVVLREESELEDTRVRQLVELLERATQQIRAEKARAKDLEKENLALRHIPPHFPEPVHDINNIEADPRYIGLHRTLSEAKLKADKYDQLRQRHRELALENQMAVEQIAVLRLKCIDLQVALESERSRAEGLYQQNTELAKQANSSHAAALDPAGLTWQSATSTTTSGLSAGAATPTSADRMGSMPLERRVPRENGRQAVAPPHSRSGGRREPSPGHPAARRPSPTRALPAPPAYPADGSAPNPHTVPTRTLSPMQRSASPSGRPPSRSTSVPPSPKDEVLIHRMIRALSPPPTASQLGRLVDAMVRELLRNLQERGVELPLRRAGPCAYTLHGRRLNLSVVSDRLVVKVGGGHQDLLEYLQKAKGLRSRAKPP